MLHIALIACASYLGLRRSAAFVSLKGMFLRHLQICAHNLN
jgi:hypothetical protein